MKQKLRLTLLLALLALSTHAQRNWRLIWSDEFNTPGRPDTAVWV